MRRAGEPAAPPVPHRTIRWTPARAAALEAFYARAKAHGFALSDDSDAIETALRVGAESTVFAWERAARKAGGA